MDNYQKVYLAIAAAISPACLPAGAPSACGKRPPAPARFGRAPRKRECTCAPTMRRFSKVIRRSHGRSAEADAPRFCRRNTLRLPSADVLPLRLRHKGQDLQHKAGNEGPHYADNGRYLREDQGFAGGEAIDAGTACRADGAFQPGHRQVCGGHKDFSAFAIAKLTDKLGVSTDCLLCRTENKNHPNTEPNALRLSDTALDVLTY